MIELVRDNNRFIFVLGIFIVLDIVSGLIKATIEKQLNSTTFREGLLKKLLELILCVVGFGLDYALDVIYIGKSVLIFTVGMEGMSILENAGKFIPLPQKLKDILQKLNDEEPFIEAVSDEVEDGNVSE